MHYGIVYFQQRMQCYLNLNRFCVWTNSNATFLLEVPKYTMQLEIQKAEKISWKIKPSAKSIRTSSTISSRTRDESTEPAILRRASEWRRVPDPWHFDWQLLTTTQLAPASPACRAQRGLSSLGEPCNQLGLTEINNAPDQRHVSHSSITRSSRVHWLHCFRNCRMDSNRGADFIVLSAGKGWDGKTDSQNP